MHYEMNKIKQNFLKTKSAVSSRRNCCDATDGNRWWGRETISKDAYTKKQTIEHQNFAPEDIPLQFIG